MAYRAKPMANGHSPAELLMGWHIRTTFPLVPSSLNPGWPVISKLKDEEHNSRQKQWKNFNRRQRAHDLPELKLGDHVTDTKEKGTVNARADAPRSYIVETLRGNLCWNHSHLVSTPALTATSVDLPDITHPYSTVDHHLAEQSHSQPQSLRDNWKTMILDIGLAE